MERNWKGKLSKSKTRERIGKLSNYFREERKGLLSKIIGQLTMYVDRRVFYIFKIIHVPFSARVAMLLKYVVILRGVWKAFVFKIVFSTVCP